MRLYLVQGVKSHANSHRICVDSTQKDSRGCGACRMATVYRTVESFDSKSTLSDDRVKNSTTDFGQSCKNTPGTGVFFVFLFLAVHCQLHSFQQTHSTCWSERTTRRVAVLMNLVVENGRKKKLKIFLLRS